jgi:hypothetical protein
MTQLQTKINKCLNTFGPLDVKTIQSKLQSLDVSASLDRIEKDVEGLVENKLVVWNKDSGFVYSTSNSKLSQSKDEVNSTPCCSTHFLAFI